MEGPAAQGTSGDGPDLLQQCIKYFHEGHSYDVIVDMMSSLQSQFWMELFADLRDAGYFNGSHEHQRLLRYCFGDVVQKDLDECVGFWNSHRIRPSKNSIMSRRSAQ
ncbi:hypothetical protein D4764_0288970 [Takifugu flavidus]|uniref:Uncharacterized protein n=1 Tax=Takifugu flavidus TaxID=433684 RepID=A0A5C6MJ18_9TELE|nr:hypothetical protein D4764_0288970 [Takifugu flavidus]